MKKLKLAVKWEVKTENNIKSIQLYDINGLKLSGKESYWEGNFNCSYNNLTSLEGSPKEIGGDFYCYSNKLTSLEGSPIAIGGGFNCNNNKLTSLEGSPKEIGGYFNCNNNKLTSLKGSPKEIGGDFYCNNNKLTYEGISNSKNAEINIFNMKLKKGYIYADGILSKLLDKYEENEIEFFKVRNIGSKKESFVVKKGNVFSHGEDKTEALLDLKFKLSDRSTDIYKKWNIETKKSLEEMIIAYRVITGACRKGVKDFVANNNLKGILSVQEVINITSKFNAYGSNNFLSFFNNTKKGD